MASEFLNSSSNVRLNQANPVALPAVRQANNKSQNGNVRPVTGPDLPDKSSAGKHVSQHDLEHVTEMLNQIVQSRHHKLQFSLDSGSGRTVIKVINKDTDEIIRQYPPDEILSLSKMITENLEVISETGTGILLETQG